MRLLWWLLAALVIAAALGYLAYLVLLGRKGRRPGHTAVHAAIRPEKAFDYRKEAYEMLEKARRLFDKGEHKDAYMLAGQALRLYLGYKNSLTRETTNDELIAYLKKRRKPFRKAKECLDLCSLVEFARYEANRRDFERITTSIMELVSE